MKRLDWIVAAGLVVLGLLCLLIASGAGMGNPMNGMMGGMMVSMRLTAMLFIAILFLVALTLIVYLVRTLTRGDSRSQHCTHCGRRLESAWRACPYCGERVFDPDRS